MKYKLIGIRPNHVEMKLMVGKSLFRINEENEVERCYITDIRLNDDNKWEFIITGEENFKKHEPLFISMKSVKRYAKKNQIKLIKFYY